MVKPYRIVWLVTLFSMASFGQVRYQTQIFSTGFYPFPTVRVCTEPATGTPCTPLALIYSDSGLTQPLTNPLTGDINGNVFFYASTASKYHLQVSGVGLTPYDLPDITLPGGGGGGGGAVSSVFGRTGVVVAQSGDYTVGQVTGAATDSLVVHLAGTESITGAKTFTQPVNVTGPNTGVWSIGCSGTDPGVGSGIAFTVTNGGCTPYTVYMPSTSGSGFWVGSNSANKHSLVFQQSIDLTQNVGISILPLANGGCGNSTASGCFTNIAPTPIRIGDFLYWNGTLWNNFGGNTTTPAFFTENSGGSPGWVQVPIPPIDGGTGLTTLALNTFYKGNTTSGMLASSMVEASGTLTISEPINATTYQTATNCAVNSVSPAACGSASAGAVVIPTSTATYTINTTAVTSHSRIQLTWLTFASDLPSSPTCVAPSATTHPTISGVSAGVSFTIALTSTTGQTCPMYEIKD